MMRKMEKNEAILREIRILCDEVISGNRKIDNTFFSTRKEAEAVKEACDQGDINEVLSLLYSFRGEPNPAEFIARLEAARVTQPVSAAIPAANAKQPASTQRKARKAIEGAAGPDDQSAKVGVDGRSPSTPLAGSCEGAPVEAQTMAGPTFLDVADKPSTKELDEATDTQRKSGTAVPEVPASTAPLASESPNAQELGPACDPVSGPAVPTGTGKLETKVNQQPTDKKAQRKPKTCKKTALVPVAGENSGTAQNDGIQAAETSVPVIDEQPPAPSVVAPPVLKQPAAVESSLDCTDKSGEKLVETKPRRKDRPVKKIAVSAATVGQDAAQETTPVENPSQRGNCEFRVMKVHELAQDDGRFKFETSKTHRNNLFTSIKEIGFDSRYPLFAGVLPDGSVIIFDGNTRYEEGLKAGLTEFPVLLRKFNTIEEIRLAGVIVQIGRRSTSRRDQMRLIVELESVARDKARAHQGKRTNTTSGSRDPEVSDSVNANKWLASMMDISESMVKRQKKIIGSKYEDAYAKGEIGAREAYEHILREERKAAKKTDTLNNEGERVTQAEPKAPLQLEQGCVPDQAPSEPTLATDNEVKTTNAPVISSDAVVDKVPADSDETVGSISVPINFLQRVAARLGMEHGGDFLDILGGPDSEAGRIFNDALNGCKSKAGTLRHQRKASSSLVLTCTNKIGKDHGCRAARINGIGENKIKSKGRKK